MATITSTIADFSLKSTYTCKTLVETLYVTLDGSVTPMVSGTTASTPTTSSATHSFTYTSITEPINMAILQFNATSTYGASIWINDTQVYASGGSYTLYLTPAQVGTSSSTFTFKFKSYATTHNHYSNYDRRQYIGTTSPGIASEYVESYYHIKDHEAYLSLSGITLKIYTGNDSANVPSTPLICVGVNDIAKKVTDMYVGVNGVAKKISDAWVGVNGVARKIWPCLELKDVPAGSLIQLTEDQDGNLALYRVMGHNHYASGSTVLMREYVLKQGRFGTNTNNSNSYFGQTADKELNETWKATLHGPLLMKLVPTNIYAQTFYPKAAGSVPTESRQIWLPALNEVSAFESSADGYQNESTRFSYFTTHTTATDLIAYNAAGTKCAWWTRSPVFGTQTAKLMSSATDDPVYNREAANTAGWYRPVFCLPSNIPVSPIDATTYDLIL